jgi:hypothetical protein
MLSAEMVVIYLKNDDIERYYDVSFQTDSLGNLEIHWETENGNRADVYYLSSLNKVVYRGIKGVNA